MITNQATNIAYYIGRYYLRWCRGSSSSIVSDCGLDDRGSIPGGAKDFSTSP
jgi:hypothetical protein